MTTTATPASNSPTAPAPTNLEQVVTSGLWSLPIPLPQGEAEPADVKDYKALHDAKLAAIEKRVKTLPKVVDEKTLDVNQKALTALVKVRTGLDKARKALFDPVKRLKEDADAYIGTNAESGLQARVKAMERPIEEAMQEYRDAIERKRQEAERILEQRNNDRIAYILASGMTFDGQKYTLGELILWPVDLKNHGEPEWMAWLEKKLKLAVEAHKAALAEEEAEFARKKAEEEEEDRRREAAFKKQQEDQARMDEERAALDREKAELRKQKQDLRAQELLALGAEVHEIGYFHVEDFCQVVSDLAGLNDEDWTMAKDAVRRSKVTVIERDKENLRQMALEDERAKALRALPLHRYDGDSVWTLGEATVTDYQLRTFTSDEWAACLQGFEIQQSLGSLSAIGRMITVDPEPDAVDEVRIMEGPVAPTVAIDPEPEPEPEPEPVAYQSPAGQYAPLRVMKPLVDPSELRYLQGTVLELEAAMVSAGSSAESTNFDAHRALFLRIESSCRLLHGEAKAALNNYEGK